MGVAIFIILLIIIGFIVILVTWVMAAPFVFYLNTDRQMAYAKISGMGKAEVSWVNLQPEIKLNLFFFTIPLPKGKKVTKEKKTKPKKKAKLNVNPAIVLKYTKAIIKSFNVKIFRLKLDTGDYMLNAWLYPVFCLIRNDKNISCSVNFDDTLSLEMMVTNRIGRMAWLGLRMWMKMKK